MKNPSSFDPLAGEVRWPRRVATPADAVRFIDAVGYCLLFPLRGVPLPSLYYVCAHREPADWDRYCQLIWKWKDHLGHRRRALYARYFKGRGTFISLNLLPHFLAMEGSTFAAGDFDRAYAAGRITADARLLWEELAAHGPLATLELRHACRFDTTAGNRCYKKAMLQLSRMLVIFHSGTEQESEAWASSRFELTARAFPQALAAGRRITPEDARCALAQKYLAWHSSATPQTLAHLFRWPIEQAAAAALWSAAACRRLSRRGGLASASSPAGTNRDL
jgi:hypothetical protein